MPFNRYMHHRKTLIFTELDLGMTFASAAAAAYGIGNQLRGDGAAANAEEAYDAAVILTGGLSESDRAEVRLQINMLRAALDVLPVTVEEPALRAMMARHA